MIQCKTKEFAPLLDALGFEASSEWLTPFRDWHGIAWKTICGESKHANHEAARTWRDKKLRDIISGYSPDDIYNADKTGMFYQVLPSKGHCAVVLQRQRQPQAQVPSGRKICETAMFQRFSSPSMHI